MRKFLIALVTKSTYVLFGVLYVVYLAYTVFPLMDLVVEFVTPLSWFIKVPAFIAFGVLSTAIALVGALPLFWMDREQILLRQFAMKQMVRLSAAINDC